MAPSDASFTPIPPLMVFLKARFFPAGPWRPKERRHRGSVMDMPGVIRAIAYDPESAQPTRQTAQGREAPRLRIFRSFRCRSDAQPLMAALKGPRSPCSRGEARCRSLSHRPGPAQVHLKEVASIGHQAAVQRDCDDSRPPRIPTSGSFAAITTTAG